VFADPGDQFVSVLIVVEQLQQLSALSEAMLLGDVEILIKSFLDGTSEIARPHPGRMMGRDTAPQLTNDTLARQAAAISRMRHADAAGDIAAV
jgi:hypothetical protein